MSGKHFLSKEIFKLLLKSSPSILEGTKTFGFVCLQKKLPLVTEASKSVEEAHMLLFPSAAEQAIWSS